MSLFVIKELFSTVPCADQSKLIENKNIALEHENQELRKQTGKPLHGLDRLIGNSPAMAQIHSMITQIAPTRATVLVQGESGTGKELVAGALHALSGRPAEKLVTVNCAALSPQLLESELFGHEKGAFTGATQRRIGRFEQANGGTLFLDEIGEIDQATQVKLLRALSEKTIERVGSNTSVKIDVRVIAATNKNLRKLVAKGEFREDLYYRLNVFPIEVPSLRDRVEDIPLLINELISRMEKEKRGSLRMNSAAIMSLCRHDWPGNVRELANLVERMAIMFPYGVVDAKDLPAKFRYIDTQGGDEPNGDEQDLHSLDGGNGLFGINIASVDSRPLLPTDGIDLKEYISSLEQSLIEQALDDSSGVVARAAEKLQIRRTTLVEKMRKYEVVRR